MKTISTGSPAPDFTLPDETGRPRKLSEFLAKGPVVLFFYPGAMTSGCTAEACRFRDMNAEFAAVGAQRIGISADTIDKQQEFSTANDFDYPLLSDADREVATAYGVKRRFITPVKRATFVIGTDGKIAHVVSGEWNMDIHADEALKSLQDLDDQAA
ncbi:MAG: peroxiredoxin [Geodermatophilaceae bacterium]|nr:peroxiredoxin [Geodermatophilaceae bacterium]